MVCTRALSGYMNVTVELSLPHTNWFSVCDVSHGQMLTVGICNTMAYKAVRCALGRAGVGLPPSYTQINTGGAGVRRILGPLGLFSQAATSLNLGKFV